MEPLLAPLLRLSEPLIFVEPHKWVRYFQGLFSINNDRMFEGLHETQMLGPSEVMMRSQPSSERYFAP
jgi:hypothetical protein